MFFFRDSRELLDGRGKIFYSPHRAARGWPPGKLPLRGIREGRRVSAISARYDMTKFGLVITWVGKGSEPTGSKVLADLHGSNQCYTIEN